MNFGEVLSRAWHIVWKYKVLWIFGILAGCTSSSGSGGNGISWQLSDGDIPGFQWYFESIPDWQIALWVFLLLGLVLLFIAIVIVLGTIGRIGLIRGAMQGDVGAERIAFGELFRGSFPYFWRVFGLNLLFFIAIFLAIMLIFGFFALAGVVTLGVALICLIPLICLLIPIGWFVAIIIEQANVALVVENTGIFDAVGRGWRVVSENIGEVILMGLILILGGGIVGFLLFLPFAFTSLPLIINLFTAGINQNLAWGIGLSILCAVLYLPVLLALSGILRAYIGSAWTLTYLRLTGRTPVVVSPDLPQVEPTV